MMFKNKNTETNSINGNSMAFRTPQIDVLSIMKRNKLEEKELMRKNIILAAATLSVIAILGLLISL